MKARLTKKTVLPDWLLISDAKMTSALSNWIEILRILGQDLDFKGFCLDSELK